MNKGQKKYRQDKAKESDHDIGLRVKILRKALGISQMKLAEGVGVSFQQIQKYESGENKISVEKLRKIASFFNTPLGYFLGTNKESFQRDTTHERGRQYGNIYFEDLSKEEIELVLRLRAVKNSDVKKGIHLILKGIVQY